MILRSFTSKNSSVLLSRTFQILQHLISWVFELNCESVSTIDSKDYSISSAYESHLEEVKIIWTVCDKEVKYLSVLFQVFTRSVEHCMCVLLCIQEKKRNDENVSRNSSTRIVHGSEDCAEMLVETISLKFIGENNSNLTQFFFHQKDDASAADFLS